MSDYSLGDLAAVTGSENGFGGSGAWVLIILFALIFGNGNWFGGNRNGDRSATVGDVQRATDFAALERQNNEGVAATRQAAYDVTGAIKDGNYNVLGEIRDLQAATSSGFSTMQQCCCEQLRAIDGVNYNGAINTASINATTTAQTQKILDALAQNKIDSLTAKVNELQMQNMFCGVPRISTVAYGVYPYNTCGASGNI